MQPHNRVKALAAGLVGIFLGIVLVLPATAQPAVTDGRIAGAVETEIWNDPLVDANAIDVSVSDGVVTLGGPVDNILARDQALHLTRNISGVRGIIDHLRVKDGGRSDQAIQAGVMAALARDPATEAPNVQADVEDGVVTLEGNADSYAEKQLAATVAKGVRGVTGVQNRIDVLRKVDRPDREIAKEVKARLMNDVRVDDKLVAVTVDDGVVTLAGNVGSLAERRRAGLDAWVNGVKAVENNLEVKAWARDTLRREAAVEPREDEKLQEAVVATLSYDPRVNSINLDVTVDSGVVTLRGVVSDARAKRAAEESTENVTGVFTVRNFIKVRPDEIPPDDRLERRVIEALAEDPVVERHGIGVDAYNGRVTLSGAVDSSFEAERAANIAFRTQGVVDVRSRLDYEFEWEWRPDPTIREEVTEQLFWSPYVDEDELIVKVVNGVVTLRGEVGTWSEREAAEHNAWQGGAKEVDNQITVANQAFGPLYY